MPWADIWNCFKASIKRFLHRLIRPRQADKMQLQTYAAEADIDGVRRELERGIAVDARDERDFTPLACAVSSLDSGLEMLQVLIDAGADVNAAVDPRLVAVYQWTRLKD